MATAVTLHLLAAVIWVGGMFFAIYVMRLAAGPMEPPERVALWGRGFKKFFPWVWIASLPTPSNRLLHGLRRLFWLQGFTASPTMLCMGPAG